MVWNILEHRQGPSFPEDVAHSAPALWRAILARYGDADVIKMRGEKALSYRDVDRRSAALARGLIERGAGKGTRIGLLMSNSPDWLVSWLAIERIGGIAVTLSTLFSSRELQYGLRTADVSILLTAARYLRNDYVGRLADAFPALQSVDPRNILIEAAPYLRQIWTVQDSAAPFIAGTIADLEAIGEASAKVTPALLAAIEDQVSPADSGMLIYTSGSTSDPKGIVHTQGALIRKIRYSGTANSVVPSAVYEGDRPIVGAPFFWVGGFLNLMVSVHNGACVICDDDHSPAATMSAMIEEGATHASLNDVQWEAFKQLPDYSPAIFAQLRPLNTKQSPWLHPDQTIHPKRFPRSIGMTETIGPHAGVPEPRLLPEEIAGTQGAALPGMEYKIVDPLTGDDLPMTEQGELCVRGVYLMQGMYKRERDEVFDKDGFYHTGDLVQLSPDGHIFFRSRFGGMIKTSGANVSPDEVEVALREEKDVLDAAVMGLPDAMLGQMVVAVVAVAPGCTLDEAEIRKRMRERLSPFKVPKRVLFCALEEMPRTASDKIKKGELLQWFGPDGQPRAQASA